MGDDNDSSRVASTISTVTRDHEGHLPQPRRKVAPRGLPGNTEEQKDARSKEENTLGQGATAMRPELGEMPFNPPVLRRGRPLGEEAPAPRGKASSTPSRHQAHMTPVSQGNDEGLKSRRLGAGAGVGHARTPRPRWKGTGSAHGSHRGQSGGAREAPARGGRDAWHPARGMLDRRCAG